jgi:hypothetical protein
MAYSDWVVSTSSIKLSHFEDNRILTRLCLIKILVFSERRWTHYYKPVVGARGFIDIETWESYEHVVDDVVLYIIKVTVWISGVIMFGAIVAVGLD